MVYDGEPEIRVRQSCNLPIKPSYHHHTNAMVPYQTIIPPPYHIRPSYHHHTISDHHSVSWYTIIDTSDGHQLQTQNTVSPDLPHSDTSHATLAKRAGLGLRKCDNSVRKSVHHIYLVWISIFPCFHISVFCICQDFNESDSEAGFRLKGSERRSAAQ